MIRCLVLVKNYVIPDKSVAMMFAHVRNKFYQSKGIDVTVLNFSTEENYEVEGIKVISLKNYSEDENYDILISHAPELEYHYKFLSKYGKNFPKHLFFFHGQEVFQRCDIYPKPFSYMPKRKDWKVRLYDTIKLWKWKKYFHKTAEKNHYVFVSKYLEKNFKKYVKLSEKDLYEKTSVIHNSVGAIFEKESYDVNVDKEFDFITIRSNMDSSKYAIDLMNEVAKANPECSFLFIGRGKFFEYNKKADNIQWVNRMLNHEEMLNYLNKSRMGFMLTRNDTQGVMTCEIHTFGLPVITSDIEVCREIFAGCKNAYLVDNSNTKIDLKEYLAQAEYSEEKNKKFLTENTIEKEIDLIQKLVGEYR